MINSFSLVRKTFAPVFVLGFLILPISASRLLAQSEDCQSALDGSSGYTSLANGDTAMQTDGVVEWDGEVIKLHTDMPGVLTISAVGDDSQGALYTNGSSTPHPLVDSAIIGTNQGVLTTMVSAGNHCIELAPGTGASGDVEVEVSFEDMCHYLSWDDHGDSFLCATAITVGGSSRSGVINSGTSSDSDMFTFVLSSSATVTIASTGSGNVGGDLYDASGTLIASDNSGWSSANFQIIRSLSAGRYYVRIKGVTSSIYSLSAS